MAAWQSQLQKLVRVAERLTNRITVVAFGVFTASMIAIAYCQERGWEQLWPTLLILAVVAGLVCA
jgi:hypothetical protein